MIALKYVCFAVIATVLNLLTQALSLSIYFGAYSLYVAMTFGTLVGLVSKYALDKQFIFGYQPASRMDNVNRFLSYSLTGVFTTAVFWITEITFDAAWESDLAKYVGAVVGLSIGYVLKYYLDKRFVFGGNTT